MDYKPLEVAKHYYQGVTSGGVIELHELLSYDSSKTKVETRPVALHPNTIKLARPNDSNSTLVNIDTAHWIRVLLPYDQFIQMWGDALYILRGGKE